MPRRLFAAIAAGILALSVAAAGQTNTPAFGNVTFSVPLNLTLLPTDITSVRIFCVIQSTALGAQGSSRNGHTDITVSNRQVVTTAEVAVPISSDEVIQANAVGTSASYQCRLMGRFTSLNDWDYFDDPRPGVPRLSPLPGRLTGTFTW